MFLARLLMPVLLCIALYWSLRLGYADDLARRGTPRDVARAIALTPGNARLYALSDAGLETASRLNPWNSGTWIQSGLRSESEGDAGEAERLMLEAALVDHTFKPLWTLANFYARADLPEKFWPCVRACLKIENHDPTPVFGLCWRVTEDASLIANAIPPIAAVRAEYLLYLIRTGRIRAAAAAYAQLRNESDVPREDRRLLDRPLLLDYCDFLLARNSSDSLSPWNATTESKLNPDSGISLTNGDFNRPPTGRGFDWRLPVEPGISANLFGSPSLLRLTMDGDENEDAGLLWQMLPLLPSRRYRLQFRYRTSDIPPVNGLHWQVGDFMTGPDLSSDTWREEALDFETPRALRLARLSLRYHRPAGAMRIKGSISLAHLRLNLRP